MKKQIHSIVHSGSSDALFQKASIVTVLGLLSSAAVSCGSADYGPAIWRPICNANWYTSGYGKKFYVIHDMEGYYASVLSSFASCGFTSASVHYAINGKKDASSDYPAGEVTQLGVADANYAWHACCWNQHSMGTEHEGFASNPAWYTPEMYNASAALTRSKCIKYNFARDRNHVVAHGEKSNSAWVSWAGPNLGINATCQTHTDPGPYWNWSYYMGLINGGTGKKKADINGDGKSDILTFTRGTQGYVWTALSGGGGFGNSAVWHNSFCFGSEVPLTGDFNGDGKTDIVTFTRGSSGWAVVSLSNGGGFAPAAIWATGFCMGTEFPAVGDVNGDGKDDILTFVRGSVGYVWVALSTGNGFAQGAIWHNSFCFGSEIPCVADFNGDGRADIATFTRGTQGWVWVALSSGGNFGQSGIWHNSFCFGNEIPAVGDFNGDGKADIVTFTRSTSGWAVVSLSSGGNFGGSAVWHNSFCFGDEIPGVGDFNGDGKDDIATFTRGTSGWVAVATSSGGGFNPSGIWKTGFCLMAEIPAPAQAFFIW